MDSRPDLPEIFPQDEVSVEGEEHTFKVSQLDSGTQKQYEYTLNKAPIAEINSVQGIDEDGNSRTFSNGVDYELASKTDAVSSTFTFDPDSSEYLLRYPLDTGTDSVIDESGDTYVNGTDYAIRDSDDHYGDLIEWLDGGDTPENNEEFTVSYDVTFPSSVLQWQTNAENLPQADSIFYVTYRADSIISRYIDAHEEELNNVDEALQEVINNKFIDTASGEALDELGKLFGPTIGKRRGRSDEQYRIYLKSIVQSFVSRGTVNGIKLAISAATEVPLDDIQINEDFDKVQYEIQLQAATPVTVKLLEEVAEIADPSGVDQARTRFVTDPDEMVVQESLSITEGQQFFDDMAVSDDTGIFNRSNFEDVTLDDATAVNPNKIDAGTDSMFSDDTFAIDPNKFTVPDDMGAADEGVANRAEANETLETDDAFAIDPNLTETTDVTDVTDTIAVPRVDIDEVTDVSEVLNVEPSDKNAHRWEDDGEPSTTGWSFFEWTEILDFARAASDTAFADDAAAIPPKAAVVSDEGGSADSVDVRFNVESVDDDAGAADTVAIQTPETTSDIGGSADTVTNVATATVSWEGSNWNSFDWAGAVGDAYE